MVIKVRLGSGRHGRCARLTCGTLPAIVAAPGGRVSVASWSSSGWGRTQFVRRGSKKIVRLNTVQSSAGQWTLAEPSPVSGATAGTAPQQKTCLTCRLSFGLRHFTETSSQPNGRRVNCRGCSLVKRRLDKLEREMGTAQVPGGPLDRCCLPFFQQLRCRHHAPSCTENSRAQVWHFSLPGMLQQLHPVTPMLNRSVDVSLHLRLIH